MKGVPKEPRCGFSRLVIETLKFYDINKYSFVNVMAFVDLRNTIKEITDWPTFPQLFCNGELVGGSDIIIQLHKEGKLENILKENK